MVPLYTILQNTTSHKNTKAFLGEKITIINGQEWNTNPIASWPKILGKIPGKSFKHKQLAYIL